MVGGDCGEVVVGGDELGRSGGGRVGGGGVEVGMGGVVGRVVVGWGWGGRVDGGGVGRGVGVGRGGW